MDKTLEELHNEYRDCVQEMEDSGDRGHIVPLDEWLKTRKENNMENNIIPLEPKIIEKVVKYDVLIAYCLNKADLDYNNTIGSIYINGDILKALEPIEFSKLELKLIMEKQEKKAEKGE